MSRTVRAWLLSATAALAAGTPAAVAAQTVTPDAPAAIRTLSDTVDAVAEARRAARQELVTGYFLASFVATPGSIASALTLHGEGELDPRMLIAPALFVVTTARASRTVTLPPALERTLAGADSAYAEVFRRTYARTLTSRRQTAVVIGGISGIVGSVLFLAWALRGYT